MPTGWDAVAQTSLASLGHRPRNQALVIEDDVFIAFAIEGLLLDAGFKNVIVATTDESAICAGKDGNIDLLVCDLGLGPYSANGIDVLESIDPTQSIPTLIYTAADRREVETALRGRRPNAGIIHKPASDEKLWHAVEALMAHLDVGPRSPNFRKSI